MTKPPITRRFFHTQKQEGNDFMKLKAMLDKWDAGELSFKPTCPREHRLLSVLLGSLFIFFANYS